MASLGGAPGVTADLPDVDAQDDSSFAWVVFREVFADGAGTHARAVARKLVGSQFDAGVVVDGIGGFPSADSAGPPRIDINGRGEGYAASAGTATVFGAVLKDRVFNPGVPIGTGFAGQALPVAATDENGDGLVAWQNADLTIHARAYTNVRASRAVQSPQPEVALSGGADRRAATASRRRPTAPATSPSPSCRAPPGGRQLVVALVRPRAGRLPPSSGTSFRNVARPRRR